MCNKKYIYIYICTYLYPYIINIFSERYIRNIKKLVYKIN